MKEKIGYAIYRIIDGGGLEKVEREYEKFKIESTAAIVDIKYDYVLEAKFLVPKGMNISFAACQENDMEKPTIRIDGIFAYIKNAAPDAKHILLVRKKNIHLDENTRNDIFKDAKKNNMEVFIKVMHNTKNNAKALACSILNKYNQLAKEYLALDEIDRINSPFYLISAEDFVNDKVEQNKVLEALIALPLSQHKDTLNRIVIVNTSDEDIDTELLESKTESLFVHNLVSRAYTVSMCLERMMFSNQKYTTELNAKMKKETEHMQNYVTLLKFGYKKGYN